MKLTIYDIAKKAGVSIATVSRAMNPERQHEVNPETLEKIQEIVKECQYVPNIAARHLAKDSYDTVGVIIPHHTGVFFSDYYTKVLNGISDTLYDSKYHFKLLMLKDEKKWDNYNFRTAEGVDGIIIVHWPYFFSDKQTFGSFNFPCVVINDMEEDIKAHFVNGDTYQGGCLAAEYLLSKGHRKIALMTGPSWLHDNVLRLQGFTETLKSAGIDMNPELVICGDGLEHLAYERIDQLLQLKNRFSALFCFNDAMAYGVLRRLGELGVKCPEDLSIMGFDNEDRTLHTTPPLTTIEQPMYRIAQEAAQLIVDRIEGPQEQDTFIRKILPVSLVERESVRQLG